MYICSMSPIGRVIRSKDTMMRRKHTADQGMVEVEIRYLRADQRVEGRQKRIFSMLFP